MNKNKGITLIALIITIVILLILAGIAVAQLTGNGLFARAKQAKQNTIDAQEKENVALNSYEEKIDEVVGSRDTVTIDKKEYEMLKKKGTYELLATKTKSELTQYTNGFSPNINVGDLNRFSEIVLLGYSDSAMLGEIRVPISEFKLASGLWTHYDWGEIIVTSCKYIDDNNIQVQIHQNSLATKLTVYGIY